MRTYGKDKMTKSSYQRLKRAGYTDGEIAQISAIIAGFVMVSLGILFILLSYQ